MNPHRGYLYRRVHHNPLEEAFAQKWEDENKTGNLLHLIVGDRERITKSECYVAATVVQWLGSNVGISFVESCLMKCGHRLKWNGFPSYTYRDDTMLQAMARAEASKDAHQELFDLSEAH